MLRQIPERDWKLWRKLSAVALERFCAGVLEEVCRIAQPGGDAHARYRKLFQVLRERDDVIAAVFDDQRRSNAFFQITRAAVEGLLTEDEIALFSDETQAITRVLRGDSLR
ncbi:MAG TPA: peptide ABC transporter substrate-binding protein [Thermoanaerobaculia bacterium]|nr:peptide ABC transporter substrate-binding protein [Thermoanaerobaculia bacterium]